MTNVIVTGASGFIGSHLANSLAGAGYDVHVIARSESALTAAPNTHIHRIDKKSDVRSVILQVKPQIIFHLAGLVIPWHRPSDLESLVDSNISFGCQILDALANVGGSFFVNTGTYAQHFSSARPYPANLYAATKQAFEQILRFYTEAFHIPAVTLRLFDVYGPGDRRPKIFNLFDSAAKTGSVLRMSLGEQQLDLIYVDDVVRAFKRAADWLQSGNDGNKNECFYVGTGRMLTIKQIVDIYRKITGKTVNVEWGGIPYRPRQIMIPQAGPMLPDWKSEIDLETGIRMMMDL